MLSLVKPGDTPGELTADPPIVRPSTRLISLDACRGFIMLILAGSGFGLGVLKNYPEWAWLAAQWWLHQKSNP